MGFLKHSDQTGAFWKQLSNCTWDFFVAFCRGIFVCIGVDEQNYSFYLVYIVANFWSGVKINLLCY